MRYIICLYMVIQEHIQSTSSEASAIASAKAVTIANKDAKSIACVSAIASATASRNYLYNC